MKQLEKLGLSGAKVLSDDQMKTITGGQLIPVPMCTPYKPGETCSASASCSVTDSEGKVRYGSCDTACRCHLFADPGGPIVIPD